jgi:hypothetical protein
VSTVIELEFETQIDLDFRGKVSGKLGEITLVLVDKSTISPVIKSKALLLDDDSVPFLIGFEDIMSDIKLVCDYASKTSFFHIP